MRFANYKRRKAERFFMADTVQAGVAMGKLGSVAGNEDWEAAQLLRKTKWADATPEQKLDKLRMELQDMRYIFSRIQTLETSLHHLKNHTHSENGRLMIPMDNVNNMGMLGGVASSLGDNLS